MNNMELWIRSQDKKSLIRADYIEYEEWNKEHRIYINGEVCGKYKTKERALEVLNKIQNCLLASFNFDGSYEEVDLKIKAKMINGLYGIIYEMPQE